MLEYTVLMFTKVAVYAAYHSEVFILKLALAIVQLVLAIALVAIVLLQQSRRVGLSGTISGGADTFFSKNKSKGLDALLVKLTVVIAAIFVIVTLLLNFGLFA